MSVVSSAATRSTSPNFVPSTANTRQPGLIINDEAGSATGGIVPVPGWVVMQSARREARIVTNRREVCVGLRVFAQILRAVGCKRQFGDRALVVAAERLDASELVV